MKTPKRFAQTWELDSLMANPESQAFEKELCSFQKGLAALADESDRLPPASATPSAADAWGAFLREYSRMAVKSADFCSFIECHAAADAAEQAIPAARGGAIVFRAGQGTDRDQRRAALRDLDDAALGRFAESNPTLAENAFFLRDRRLRARLRLPKELENLAADLAVDGLHAWSRLYDRISGELRVSVMEKGEVVEKSPGQVPLDSPHRPERENNFCAANKAWSEIADTCADALNHISGRD